MFRRQGQVVRIPLVRGLIAAVGILRRVEIIQEGLAYRGAWVTPSVGRFLVVGGPRRRRPRGGVVSMHVGVLLGHSHAVRRRHSEHWPQLSMSMCSTPNGISDHSINGSSRAVRCGGICSCAIDLVRSTRVGSLETAQHSPRRTASVENDVVL